MGEGAGTGVVLDTDGHILTNAHVVAGAESVTVTVNGEDRSATVLGGDSGHDIAVAPARRSDRGRAGDVRLR